MTARRLPPEGSPEWRHLAQVFESGTKEEMFEQANLYHVKPNSLQRKMLEAGYNRRAPVAFPEPSAMVTKSQVYKTEALFRELLSQKIQAIPEILIARPPKYKDTEDETQVALVSDSQCGVKTITYNRDIFRQRLNQLAYKIMKIASLQRRAHPISKLVIMELGDMIHGELVGKQVNLDELECPAHEQILDIFAPAFCEFLANLYQHYSSVEVIGVEGNHGWPGGKESAFGTNWDTFAMELVKAKMQDHSRISIAVERHSFFKLVEVQKHYFLMVHGDQIPMNMTVPYYGVTTKGLRWRGSINPDDTFAKRILQAFKEERITPDEAIRQMLDLPFQYVCMGHFHTANFLQFNNVTTFMNGTFVTSDSYPLKKMGLGNDACQWTFGVHPEHGVTFLYPLILS